jgi:hypothetical protein
LIYLTVIGQTDQSSTGQPRSSSGTNWQSTIAKLAADDSGEFPPHQEGNKKSALSEEVVKRKIQPLSM